jgi:hypothetical protein
MKKPPKRWNLWIAPVLLGLGLLVTPAFSPPVRAQPPADEIPDASGGEKGRPLDGYLATITLVLLALFIVGKSARR